MGRMDSLILGAERDRIKGSEHNVVSLVKERNTDLATLTQETFRDLLLECIRITMDTAQKDIADSLPEKLSLELAAFGQVGKITALDEVLSFLYVQGTFPRVIDVAVKGITKDATLIWIRPSAHPYVNDIRETWNQPPGTGPFKSIGLMLPKSIWDRPRPLSLHELERKNFQR